jgi:hypothetical protein
VKQGSDRALTMLNNSGEREVLLAPNTPLKILKAEIEDIDGDDILKLTVEVD